jgi:hypothetical protein
MVLLQFFGACCIALGLFVLARPMSVRSFASARQWEEDPEKAKQEQRAGASLLGFSFVFGGLILVVVPYWPLV